MLEKKIEYTDFNGTKRDELFYFNLTEAELAELELSENGGYTEWVKHIVNAGDSKTLAKIFKDIILKSYGERTPDGKMFVKVDKDGYNLCNNFVQTAAYSVLYMELVSDAKKASEFMNGIVPQELLKKAQEQQKIQDQSQHPALNA